MKELIAILVLTGIVALGMSFPIHKFFKKAYFWIICLGVIIAFSAFVSNPISINPAWPEVYKQSFWATNFLTYFSSGFTAAFYLLVAVLCGWIYERIRKDCEPKSKWIVSRWWNLAVWLFLAAFLYVMYWSGGGVIFFNACANMFAIFVSVFTVLIIPLIISLLK